MKAGYGAPTSITRTFEDATAWSENPDAVLMAYATTGKDLGVSVFDLWDEAIKRARDAEADLDWLKE